MDVIQTFQDAVLFGALDVGAVVGGPADYSIALLYQPPPVTTNVLPQRAAEYTATTSRRAATNSPVVPLTQPPVSSSAIWVARQSTGHHTAAQQWTSTSSNPSSHTSLVSPSCSQMTPVSELPVSGTRSSSTLSSSSSSSSSEPCSGMTFGLEDFIELLHSRVVPSAQCDNRPSVRRTLAQRRLETRQSQTTELHHAAMTDVEMLTTERLQHDDGDVDDQTEVDSGHSSPDSTTLRLTSLDCVPEHEQLRHRVSEPQLPQPPAVSWPSPARRVSEPGDRSHITELLASSLAVTHSDQACFVTDVLNRLAKNSASPPVAGKLGIDLQHKRQHYLIWKDITAGTKVLSLNDEILENYDGACELPLLRLLQTYDCYDLMPNCSKMVVLDTQLDMMSALNAFVFHGVTAAPVWDSSCHHLVGMLTVPEFISVLRQLYCQCPEELRNLSHYSIEQCRDMLRSDVKPLISIDADCSLYDAVVHLHDNNIRHVAVVDAASKDPLYLLTHRRILHFVYLLMNYRSPPSFMTMSVDELGIGAKDDIVTISVRTRLIDAVNLFVEHGVSSLAVVDDDGRLVNTLSVYDTLNLVQNKQCTNLDIMVYEALQAQRLVVRSERVHVCRTTDSLAAIVRVVVENDIHRLWVTSDDGRVLGVVTLSDIVHCLVTRHVGQAISLDTRLAAEALSPDSESDVMTLIQ